MSEGRVFLINDDDAMARYIMGQLIISCGYAVSWEPSAQASVKVMKEGVFDVAIINLGIGNHEIIQLVKDLKKIDSYCLLIVILEQDNHETSKRISELNVYDIFNKPVNLEKLFFLVRKGVELHSFIASQRKLSISMQEQNASLQKQNIVLAKRVEESTKNLTRLYEDLRLTYMQTIKVLAHTIEAKDHYTHSHSENVARYAVAIAEEMGLPAADIRIIRDACELHDLGKIGVEDNILSKDSELTAKEWDQVKKHPVTAAKILAPLPFLSGVIDLIKQHHEHYDGSGYPEGRVAEQILLGARIINLADAYDAMRSARSYRKVPLSKEESILEVKKNIGIQFDPKVVDVFMRIVDRLDV